MAKHDLSFNPPLMNAAGCLGFSPDAHGVYDCSQLGAFITNPISLTPRTPARGKHYLDFPGGFLLHTGFPNPGLEHVLRKYARHWMNSRLQVIVHLLGRTPEELSSMVRRLENVEGVSGLEVGFPSAVSTEMVLAYIQAASGELPLIVQLPLEHSAELAQPAIKAGAALVSLAPPRGILAAHNGELVQGRLYGPAVLPMMLKAVNTLTQLGLPTIAAGGISTGEHVKALLGLGAVAVQLDSTLWRAAGNRILI